MVTNLEENSYSLDAKSESSEHVDLDENLMLY
jgi:hypothetical protein